MMNGNPEQYEDHLHAHKSREIDWQVQEFFPRNLINLQL